MMMKNILILSLILTIASCNEKENKQTNNEKLIAKEEPIDNKIDLSNIHVFTKDTIDFTNYTDIEIEQYQLIDKELRDKIYVTNELSEYLTQNNLEPRIIGYRKHKNSLIGIISISKYEEGNIVDYILFNKKFEYQGHFSPSYHEIQPSYQLSTFGYFRNDIEFVRNSMDMNREVNYEQNKNFEFIEKEECVFKFSEDFGVESKLISSVKDTLICDFK